MFSYLFDMKITYVGNVYMKQQTVFHLNLTTKNEHHFTVTMDRS
jgi:hypothetical protein